MSDLSESPGQPSVSEYRFRSNSRGVTDAKESSGRVANLREHGDVGGMWENEQPVLVRGHSNFQSNSYFSGRPECRRVDAIGRQSGHCWAGSGSAGSASLKEIHVCGEFGSGQYFAFQVI